MLSSLSLHQQERNDKVTTKKMKAGNLIKSPSETTIYVPALKYTPIVASGINTGGNVAQREVEVRQSLQGGRLTSKSNNEVIDHISNFVDQLRFEHEEMYKVDLLNRQMMK